MHRNEWGDSVARCWKWLAEQYSKVVLDEWIVMPNHLHGIIVITDGRGGSRTAPTTLEEFRFFRFGDRNSLTKKDTTDGVCHRLEDFQP